MSRSFAVVPLMACLSIVTLSGVGRACNVPVFRYALERWRPDVYEVFVFHREPLAMADLEAIKKLEEASEHADRPSNLVVTPVDLSRNPAKWVTKLWDEQKATQTPWAVIQAPNVKGASLTVWSGPFDNKKISSWLDSPARQELTRRLLAGESIVWLYLTDGPVAKDDATFRKLTETLELLQNEMELPEGVGEEGSELFSSLPLKIKFSVLPVNRQSPAEESLVRQLLRGNEKHLNTKDPLVFPIFGCGRVLDALEGEDLSEDTYAAAATFLCGACSCQVKDQNPGYDLLLTANWLQILERGVPGALASLPKAESNAEPVLVPIPGTTVSAQGGANASGQVPSVDAGSENASSALLAGTLLVGLMFAASCVLTARGLIA